jgi:hypothetical protein
MQLIYVNVTKQKRDRRKSKIFEAELKLPYIKITNLSPIEEVIPNSR